MGVQECLGSAAPNGRSAARIQPSFTSSPAYQHNNSLSRYRKTTVTAVFADRSNSTPSDDPSDRQAQKAAGV
jgi:hypothetical protein